MSRYRIPSRHRGISLVEALFALLILGVGLLAIAKFQGGLTASSGQTKARAEAVQLAQDKVEELRNQIVRDQYEDNIVSGNDAVNGINAAFTRAWTATPDGGNDNRITVQVAVTWDDPKDGAQSVDLSSVIAWDDPKIGVALASGNLPGGGFLKPPTGRATTVGDKVYDSPPPGAVDNEDGTLDYVNEDGARELIDAETGRVLLTAADGSEFSTISGKVFFDWTVNQKPDPTSFFIMTSDAAYCAMDNTTLTDVGTTYKYYDYTCYVGGEWYGNVGVVSTDRTNNQNRVCVGDPSVAVTYNADGTELSTSDHPALSTIRTYRGYEDYNNIGDVSVGIGMSGGTYTAVHYTDHDFAVTTITGQAQDSSCNAPLALTSPSEFLGNPGDFFCLTDSCPDFLPTGEPPTTTILGTLTAATDPITGTAYQLPNSITVSISAGTCTLTANIAPNKKLVDYNYECVINWLGWTGGTWAGDMTVTGADVCDFSYTSPPDITLADGVIYLDDSNYGMVGFTDFPPSVVELPLYLKIAPTGSAPGCRASVIEPVL